MDSPQGLRRRWSRDLVLFLLPLSSGFASGAAISQQASWVARGPDGGEILSLRVDPRDALVVYAGTNGGGVFVSRDGGVHWSTAAAGLFASRVDDLAFAAPSALYAATSHGVFRLTDGATRWQARSAGLPEGELVGSLVVDRADPATLYCTVTRGAISGSWSIYRSSDGGATWEATPESFLPFTQRLAIAPTTPATLYAASYSGVLRSTDRGSSWTPLRNGLPIIAWVAEIAVDPGAPSTLYATLYGDPDFAVYKSTDGGEQWSAASHGLSALTPLYFASRLAVDPESPGTLYFGTWAGVFRSSDGAASWSPANPAPADRRIYALAVASSGGAVFAGGDRYGGPGGVLRSTDGGANWDSATAGIAASFVTGLSPDPSVAGRWLIRTDDQGLRLSRDDGASWSPSGGGIPDASIGEIRRDPHSPSILYAVAGASRFEHSRIYRSLDSGDSWEPRGPELGCCLGAVTVDTDGTLYATQSSRVLRSTDGGASWPAVSELPCADLELAAHPTTPGHLLLGCSRDSGLPVSPPIILSTIYRSTDRGGSWAEVLDGLEGTAFSAWTFAFDAVDPDLVYGGLSSIGGGGLVRSRDSGVSWEAAGLAGHEVRALLGDPDGSGALLAGTSNGGVLRSTDSGDSFMPLGLDLAAADVEALAADPSSPARVWAGTAGGGTWVLDREASSCAPTSTALCLGDRFLVEVGWRRGAGDVGPGRAVPLTDASGAFWFFRAENLELAVKILDAGPVNGHFWFFYGAMSTVEYRITVTDTATGALRSYDNPAGRLASHGDLLAFPSDGEPAIPAARASLVDPAAWLAAEAAPRATATSPLLLQEGRFRLEVRWTKPNGEQGTGSSVGFSEVSGAFSFFRQSNLELFAKVIDARTVSGHYWLFFGSLSNVAFELTVTDTVSGTGRVYTNPQGRLASQVDLTTF